MALTKTNTDNLCCPTPSTAASSTNNAARSSPNNSLLLYLTKLKYRYYLWTGLYMLEPHERLALHIVVGPIGVALVLYVGVFINGIGEGWTSS